MTPAHLGALWHHDTIFYGPTNGLTIHELQNSPYRNAMRDTTDLNSQWF